MFGKKYFRASPAPHKQGAHKYVILIILDRIDLFKKYILTIFFPKRMAILSKTPSRIMYQTMSGYLKIKT